MSFSSSSRYSNIFFILLNFILVCLQLSSCEIIEELKKPENNPIFIVNTTVDSPDINPGDDRCEDANGKCSLRAAIQEANTNGNFTNTIELQEATYTLDSTLKITGSFGIIINGKGQERTVIDGNEAIRVFHITGLSLVAINNLTISGGKAPELEHGGGIYMDRDGLTLKLEDITFSNNIANKGGGIYAKGNCTLEINHAKFNGNTAAYGAGIYVGNKQMTVEKCVFLDNQAGLWGGGIFVSINSESTTDGPVVIQQCLFERNRADRGGGICNARGEIGSGVRPITEILINNSTFSANTASRGGGFASEDGIAILTHITVYNNIATDGELFDGRRGGGGISIERGSATIQNSIIAGNENGDIGGVTNTENFSGINLLGNTFGVSYDASDMILTSNPQLSSLEGVGFQKAHVPLDGSPLIDSADETFCLHVDQRDSNRIAGSGCDIGAIEKR